MRERFAKQITAVTVLLLLVMLVAPGVYADEGGESPVDESVEILPTGPTPESGNDVGDETGENGPGDDELKTDVEDGLKLDGDGPEGGEGDTSAGDMEITSFQWHYADIEIDVLNVSCERNEEITYEWDVSKVVADEGMAENGVNLGPWATQPIPFTVTAAPSVAETTHEIDVAGSVTIRNEGNRSTQGLSVWAQLRRKKGYGNSWEDYGEPVAVNLGPSSSIGPDASVTYSIAFSMPPHQYSTRYKVRVYATITNGFPGWMTDYASRDTSEFNLANPTVVPLNDTLLAADVVDCPDGFSYVTDYTGPWLFAVGEELTRNITVTVTNEGAAPCQSLPLTNYANWDETGTSATVMINTGDPFMEIEPGICIESERMITEDYDWTIEKTVAPNKIPRLPKKRSETVTYTLHVTRNEEPDVVEDMVQAAGVVHAFNWGNVALTDVTVSIQPQYDTGSIHLIGSPIVIAVDQLIPNGLDNEREFPFSVSFPSVAGVDEYLLEARISGTYDGCCLLPLAIMTEPDGSNESCDYGYERVYSEEFTPMIDHTYTGLWASITDCRTCPSGLICNPAENGPWHLGYFEQFGVSIGGEDHGQDMHIDCDIKYTIEVTNVSAYAGRYVYIDNIVTLTEGDTGESITDEARLTVGIPNTSGGQTDDSDDEDDSEDEPEDEPEREQEKEPKEEPEEAPVEEPEMIVEEPPMTIPDEPMSEIPDSGPGPSTAAPPEPKGAMPSLPKTGGNPAGFFFAGLTLAGAGLFLKRRV